MNGSDEVDQWVQLDENLDFYIVIAQFHEGQEKGRYVHEIIHRRQTEVYVPVLEALPDEHVDKQSLIRTKSLLTVNFGLYKHQIKCFFQDWNYLCADVPFKMEQLAVENGI